MKKLITCVSVLVAGLVLIASSCSLAMSSEADKPKISSIEFEQQTIEIQAGEIMPVKISIEPRELVQSSIVTYELTSSNVVEISNKSSSGLLVKGVSTGNVVLSATCDGQTAYQTVFVSGSTTLSDPYIVLPTQVVEMAQGGRKTVTTSLYGGGIADNTQFAWSVPEEYRSIIAITSTANTAVITGSTTGVAKIRITHPKAAYEAEILVFVTSENAIPFYITTAQNVLNGIKGGLSKQLSVSLAGGTDADKAAFVFDVYEGIGVVELISTSNVCSVSPLAQGVAKIRVTHPKAEYPLDILFVVSEKENLTYMELDRTLLVLTGTEGQLVNASFVGPVDTAAYANFTYEISNPSIINVSQVNNSFYITGIASGSTKLVIKNTSVTYPRELLIITQAIGDSIISNENYITTSQNIMRFEKSGTPQELSMQMVGGTSADQNDFEWQVEDSSIVGVETANGTVVNQRALAATSVTNARAVLTPKGVGTTYITVTHPKVVTSIRVMVKVFPDGTLGEAEPRLRGTTGLYKVLTGGTLDVNLAMASGTIASVGEVSWSTASPTIAGVIGTGLSGQLTGVLTGVTKLTVSGSTMAEPYTALVMVGSEEQLATGKIIYLDKGYEEIVTGQTKYITVKSNNDLMLGSNLFNVENTNVGSVYARMVNDTLILQGLTPGTAELTITNSQAGNSVKLAVDVRDGSGTLEYPYTLSGQDFIGVVKGGNVNVSVSLNGGTVEEKTKIGWADSGSGNILVTGNGESAILSGVEIGTDEIYVTHSKSENSKKIVVYVVATEEELLNTVFMHADKSHYLLDEGSNVFIRLLTNATEAEKEAITWTVDNSAVVNIDSNGDSSYIRAISAGNAVVEAKYGANPYGCKIYISVRSQEQALEGNKAIEVPAIIEMVAGTNKKVTAYTKGLTVAEEAGITWTSSKVTSVTVTGNGSTAYMVGKSAGEAYVTVKNASLGIEKNILVIIYASAEQMQAGYVIRPQNTYIKIREGTSVLEKLVFGKNGFPEAEVQNIVWNKTDNGTIEMYPNGDKAQIIAKNQGICIVTITNPLNMKIATMTVEVYSEIGNTAQSGYYISTDKYAPMVIGSQKLLTARMFGPGNVEVLSGKTLYQWSIDDSAIATITPNNNECIFEAKASGQTYARISHPNLAAEYRVLVYVATSPQTLAAAFPLRASKTNYLIDVGQTINLALDTVSDDAFKIQEIQWGISNTALVNYQSVSKKEMNVTGKSAGNVVITVTHPESPIPVKYFISVKQPTQSVGKTMVTESIVGIVKGQSRNTRVITNLSEAEKIGIEWSSDNESIVTVVGSGETATLQAVGAGETQIRIKYGQLLRVLVVYVCDTEQQVSEYKAMNKDERYFRIKKNQTATINMYFAPEAPTNIGATTWQDVYDNSVVEVLAQGSTASMKGLAEGIARIRVTNPSCTTPIDIYIEVSPQDSNSGSAVDEIESKYLTTAKTLHVIEVAESLIPVQLSVVAIGISASENSAITWTNNNSDIVTVYPNANKAQVFGNKAGTATITVTHPQSQNILTITVIVGSKTTVVENKTPYIYVEKGMYETTTSTVIQIPVEVKNVINADVTKYSVTSANTAIATVSMQGSSVVVTPKAPGQTLITVHHENALHDANIVCIVKRTGDDPMIYLTTKNNYTTVSLGGYSTLVADLIGYVETDQSNYTWVSYNPETVSLSGIGDEVMLNAKAIGVAKIEARHVYAAYPLTYYVRVTNTGMLNPVYITTRNNIVSITKGQSIAVEAELVNGYPEDNSQFQWTTQDAGTVSLVGSGTSAVIKGLQTGTAAIKVMNPASLNSISIMVIVDDAPNAETLYIATDNAFVEMKPSDTSKEVSVRLVGGKPEDIYGFNWAIQSYSSDSRYADGTSKEVIAVVPGADTAYIVPKNEGVAVLRVTHPKTSYRMDIKVTVKLYSTINFASPSIALERGKSTTVGIEVPTGQTVIYESSNRNIASVTGTASICLVEGVGVGTAIITARNVTGTTADELLVSVTEPAVQTSDLYISTASSIYSMTNIQAPMSVTAEMKGTGVTLADQDALQWASGNTNVITTYGSGKTITLTPKGVGETVITIKHVKIPNYEKKVYVQVSASESSFSLSANLLTLNENEMGQIQATITNAPNLNYATDLVWNIADTTIADIIPVENGRNLAVNTKKPGSTTITATYGSLIKTVTLIVNQKKTISIATSAEVTPAQVVYIPYTVTPATETISIVSDNANCATVVNDIPNKRLVVTGKLNEGYTKITVTANGISALCTIYTNHNYYFRPSVASVRGEPKGTYTIPYEINPVQSAITVGYYPPTLMTVAIDSARQEITITPKTAGYFNLQIASAVNGMAASLPVYFYYPTIPITFTTVVTGKAPLVSPTLHSYFEPADGIIHLADGENIEFTPVINTTQYPNHGATVQTVTYTSANNSAMPFTIAAGISTTTGMGKAAVWSTTNNDVGNTIDMLKAVNYAGKMEITMQYYRGGTVQETDKKVFLVYSEAWRRK